jgi:hypothetical protein
MLILLTELYQGAQKERPNTPFSWFEERSYTQNDPRKNEAQKMKKRMIVFAGTKGTPILKQSRKHKMLLGPAGMLPVPLLACIPAVFFDLIFHRLKTQISTWPVKPKDINACHGDSQLLPSQKWPTLGGNSSFAHFLFCGWPCGCEKEGSFPEHAGWFPKMI